jgi:hypothetical protein
MLGDIVIVEPDADKRVIEYSSSIWRRRDITEKLLCEMIARGLS